MTVSTLDPFPNGATVRLIDAEEAMRLLEGVGSYQEMHDGSLRFFAGDPAPRERSLENALAVYTPESKSSTEDFFPEELLIYVDARSGSFVPSTRAECNVASYVREDDIGSVMKWAKAHSRKQ